MGISGARSVTPALLLLLVLASAFPVAAAEPGAGAFEAHGRAPLWGNATWVAPVGARLLHASADGDAMRVSAQALTVVERTILVHEDGTSERHEETYTYTDAVLTPTAGTLLHVTSSGAATGELQGSSPPPETIDWVAPTWEAYPRPPDAFVASGLGPLVALVGIEPAGGAAPPPSVPDHVGLVSRSPLRWEGPFEIGVSGTQGGFLVTSGGGTREFAASTRTEEREKGGVDVPVVGRVAPEKERVLVIVTPLATTGQAVVAVDAAIPRGSASSGIGAPWTILAAESLPLRLHGAFALTDATGALEAGRDRHEARADNVLVAGTLDATLRSLGPAFSFPSAALGAGMRPGSAPPDPAAGEAAAWSSRWSQWWTTAPRLAAAVEGDVTLVRIGNEPPVRYAAAAAAAGGGLLATALLAYFWPAVKFGLARFAVPLYSRIEKSDVTDNAVRASVLRAIEASPGIHAVEIGRRVACGWGTLVYHLGVLERTGYVSSVREGRHRRFFPRSTTPAPERAARALLANPSTSKVLRVIADVPGLAQKELARTLGLGASTVHWHVGRLLDAGLVERRAADRSVRYFPTPLARVLLDSRPRDDAEDERLPSPAPAVET